MYKQLWFIITTAGTEQVFPTHHVLYNLVFAIMLLDFQQVVAEIQHIEATLLSQKYDDHTASPVQAIPKALPETGNTTT